MNLFKMLTILNSLVILNCCGENNVLNEYEDFSSFNKRMTKKKNECVAALISTGFKYTSGLRNYILAMQLFDPEFRNEITHGKEFNEYAEGLLKTRKSQNKFLKEITDTDIKDYFMPTILKYYKEIVNNGIVDTSEIKTPEEFCTEIHLTNISCNWLITIFAKRKIQKCIDQILENYHKQNRFGNVAITYVILIKANRDLTEEDIENMSTDWTEAVRMYFKYHFQLILKYKPRMSKLDPINWCHNHIMAHSNDKITNTIEVPGDSKLTNESTKLTDEGYKTIETVSKK